MLPVRTDGNATLLCPTIARFYLHPPKNIFKDRRRLQEQQEKYGNRRVGNGGDGRNDDIFSHEPEGSGVTLVTFFSAASKQRQQQQQSDSSLTDIFREAVGQQGLSLVLFVTEGQRLPEEDLPRRIYALIYKHM